MTIYKLKEDWSSFKAGDKFTTSSYGNLYKLVNDDGKLVLAKIQPDLLTVVDGGHAWRPNEDEAYHYIDSDGIVLNEEYYIENDHTDKGRLAIGNCFKMAQEANNVRDWLKARQNIINSGARFINSAGATIIGSKRFYTVYLTMNDTKLRVDDAYFSKDVERGKVMCFDDRGVALKSIEEHRDDWLTYLGG